MKLTSLLGATAALALVAGAASAATTVIDFTTVAYGTNLSSIDGVSLSLFGGFASGSPRVGGFGYDLANSPTGSYPTADGILFHFSAPVKNVSFTFDDYGYGNANSSAYAGATLVSTNDLSGGAYASGHNNVVVSGTGITDLYVDNGWGSSRSWEYGIGSLTFSSSAPEPAAWALMMGGLGLLGGALRRRRVAVEA